MQYSALSVLLTLGSARTSYSTLSVQHDLFSTKTPREPTGIYIDLKHMVDLMKVRKENAENFQKTCLAVNPQNTDRLAPDLPKNPSCVER